MTKSTLSVCFIGHVDSGKSTTVGHFSYLRNAIDQRTMDKQAAEATALGKESFHFAFIADKNKAERERGITILNKLMKCDTPKFDLNIIDCPGHKDFIKNMVTGTAQADVGVALVPCAGGEFESAISGGTLKDHIMIAGVLGVKKLILAVNKVDAVPAADQERRFKEVSDEMKEVCKTIHPDKDPIIIPISGLGGIGLIEKGKKFEWFKGWTSKDGKGPVFTLEGALDYQTAPARPIDKPLRVGVNQLVKVPGIGTVLTGQVIHGRIAPGMAVLIQPANLAGEIKTLEIHKAQVQEVLAGDNFGFTVNIKGAKDAIEKQVKPGNVMSDQKNNPAKIHKGARARLVVVDHPKGIKKGYTPVMDLGMIHVPVKLAKLISKKIRGVAEEVVAPEIVIKGENVIAILMPQKDCVMEIMSEVPGLARFALRDGNRVVAIGAIDKLYTLDELKAEGLIEEPVKVTPAAAAKKK